ncbi:MAG: hemolysin secretion protein [Hyphomicrobiales bacterium]|nr:hemolysin secretion protein [Hyphomicrobiales bacterium]
MSVLSSARQPDPDDGRVAPIARSAASAASDVPASAATDTSAPAKRNRKRLILMGGGILAVAVGSGAFWLHGGRYVSTDNAYVRAAKLMVSTDVSGIVSDVDVTQGQHVKRGDILFRLRPDQFRISVDMARAQLAQVKLTLGAAVQDYQRLQSDIEGQKAQVALAQSNFDRSSVLVRNNDTTRASFDLTRFSLTAAQKGLESLEQQARVALVRLGGRLDLPVEEHPQFMQAQAQLDEVQRQLDHTVVRAPFTGTVTAVDSLQPGTFLVSQTASLTTVGAIGLVSDEDVWVDANIKETDLTYTKVGDSVAVTVDAYPGLAWQGHVGTINPATGGEFSILPAQNASGNWVKVVQRVPVRISIDRQPGGPVLRAGMSVNVDIDTGHQRQLSDLWKPQPPAPSTQGQADGNHRS